MTVQTGVRGTFRPPQFSVNTHDHEIREACEKKEEENIRIKTSFVIHSLSTTTATDYGHPERAFFRKS